MQDQVSEKQWTLISHLSGLLGYVVPAVGSILGPLIVWLLKKEQSVSIEEHAREALNFNISIALYLAVSSLLAFVLIGFLLIPLFAILHLVLIIKATMEADKGKLYRYPFTIRFVG